jgi:hypothetical protein
MRADVQSLMQGELGQWLAQQTTMREQAKEKAWSRWTWSAVVLMPVLAFLWFGTQWGGTFLCVITFFAVVGAGIWGYQPIAAAMKTIKVGINSAIARSLGISYEHDVQPGAEFEMAKTYGLLPRYDRSGFEDRWFGALEGHRFNLYEAHLEEQRGSGKNRHWVTLFRGAIIDMDFGRSFHSTTLLQRKGKHKKWFGLGGTKDEIKFDGHRLAYIDQVHPAFDDVFEIFSDDQVEARVLVHPSYVEHLLALERVFKGKAVRALFAKGQVIVAVESGDLFESGALDAEGDRVRVEETAEQFATLAGLALALNQNQRGRAGVIAGPDDARKLGAGGFGRKPV